MQVNQSAAGLIVGLGFFAAVLISSPPSSLSTPAWHLSGVALLMATWWMSEAVPLPITALAPLLLFPTLGITSMSGAAAPYADPVICLFLGGFIIASAIQRWSLHRRMGLLLLTSIGTRPHQVIAGLLLSTATLSMWVSNSATAMMMCPLPSPSLLS